MFRAMSIVEDCYCVHIWRVQTCNAAMATADKVESNKRCSEVVYTEDGREIDLTADDNAWDVIG